jgi:uncharacterized protein YjbI with pentapeptide repeats
MANPDHVEVVRQGAAAIAEWRRENPSVRLDLSEADLRGAVLREANLADADLAWANLTQADLAEADLSDADLFEAKLITADLTAANIFAAKLIMADLTGADVTGANLTGAHLPLAVLSDATLAKAGLIGANLSGANLTETDLTEAQLGGTSLGNCDLSQATGLAAVKHEGPSSIGVDTLIDSFRGAGNKLTADLETFFLGAGVQKELLARLPEIVGAVEYYSCFIAYGQPDLDFATRLCGDLERNGVSCWLYDLDQTPGEPTWGEIGRKRREADKMVVICSAKALIRPGALKEIEEQIDEDPDKMIPISLDNLWTEPGFQVMRAGRDLKPFLLAKNYADFSDESRHEESLQRLLKALRRKAD